MNIVTYAESDILRKNTLKNKFRLFKQSRLVASTRTYGKKPFQPRYKDLALENPRKGRLDEPERNRRYIVNVIYYVLYLLYTYIIELRI